MKLRRHVHEVQVLIPTNVLAGLERDKFDNKTVTFEEHIKSEHNMWHYLYFLVLVRVKDPTEYTGPESYVAQMIAVSKSTTSLFSTFFSCSYVIIFVLLQMSKLCSLLDFANCGSEPPQRSRRAIEG